MNIKKVYDDGLCTGCGTCAGLCSCSAIEMIIDNSKGIYVPQIDDKKCNNCGICLEVCPGHSVDFKELNLKIFGKESEDVLLGNCINCYTGYSTNYDIRYNSASGGLVTSLLISALEEGVIDGVLVTKMKKDRPLEPEPFIARTKEEIIEASKSKYCPVPANVSLKEILERDGRFAVVGLPCHIHGIRKAEKINKNLREKIILHFGLFCDGCLSFLGTEFMLQTMEIKKEDIKKIDYRGEGWPGKVKIILKNDKIIKRNYWYDSRFSPIRCTLCCDHTCELSDISFGDMWISELKEDKLGTSVIISRSDVGEQLLRDSMATKKTKLSKININNVTRFKGSSLRFRKMLKARMSLFKLISKKVPAYNTKLLTPNFIDYLESFVYMNNCLLSKRHSESLLDKSFRFIFVYIPRRAVYVIRKYYKSI